MNEPTAVSSSPISQAARQVVSLYERRFDEMGAALGTLGWNTAENQQLRFRELCRIADLSDSHVCDWGCGFGDLASYLDQHFNSVRYTGIDVSPSLLAEAKLRYPERDFRCQDIVTEPLGDDQRFDYVLISGALNQRLEQSLEQQPDEGDNVEHTRRILTALFDRARCGLAVNFLSTHVNFQRPHNYHHDPAEMLRLGRDLTRWVSLNHSYPLWEFTLYLYRHPPTSDRVLAATPDQGG